jgi:hypothetical protein
LYVAYIKYEDDDEDKDETHVVHIFCVSINRKETKQTKNGSRINLELQHCCSEEENKITRCHSHNKIYWPIKGLTSLRVLVLVFIINHLLNFQISYYSLVSTS